MAEEAKKTKRRVKDPVTFRERAIRASQESDKPKRKHRITSAAKKPVLAVFNPVVNAFKNVFSNKPFSYLIRPLKLIGKILLPSYLRNSWKELRQVTWLSWRQSIRLTIAVMIFAAVFGLMIAGIDYVLDKIFRQILLS